MINWSLAFLIIAVLAALFGFGENAQTATWLSEACFTISVGLLLLSLPAARRQNKIESKPDVTPVALNDAPAE